MAEEFLETSHKNKGETDKIPVFSLNVLAPLATVCLLPLMYYKLVPKVGTLVGGILYVGITCVVIIGGFMVLYLVVLTCYDSLGEALSTP